MKFSFDTDKIFKRNKPQQQEFQRSIPSDYWNPIYGTMSWSSYDAYNTSKAMKLSTVYRCVEIIANSIAVLPLQTFIIKDNWKYKENGDLWNLLNIAPNGTMSAFTFKKLIVQNVLLKGNAYIKINRDINNQISSFDILESDYINVLLNSTLVYYNTPISSGKKEYYDAKKGIFYDDADIIHIMNYSSNGLLGSSTVSSAALTLEISYNSEVHASNFFESGANLNGILKPSVSGQNITAEKAEALKAAFKAATSSLDSKSGNVVVLGAGMDFQPISISPRDSQLLESREFNIINICAFFGVPVEKVYPKNGASNNEAAQIDFLNSTLLAWCEKIEIEMYRKIYSPIEYAFTELEFIVDKLLRLDAAAQATYFSQMYQMGAISTNEIREKQNAAYPVAGGNKHFVQVNLQDINNLVVDQNNSIDNKLK